MKDFQYWFSMASAIVALVGIVLYIKSVIEQKGAAPSIASWLIWATFDSIAGIGMYLAGTVNFQIVSVAGGNWVTLGFVLFYGKWKLTRLEIFCIALAGLGVVFGIAIRDPVAMVLITLAAVFIGSWPTLESGIFSPWKEDRTAWILFALSSVLQLFAVPAWTLGDAAQPIVFLSISGSMVIMTMRRYVRPAETPG